MVGMHSVAGNKAVFVVLVALLLAVSMGSVFVLCTMNMDPLEHLSEWQSTFAAVAQQAAAVTLLSLFVLIVFWQVLQGQLLPAQTGVIASRQRDTGRVFDLLRLAFARGILHTKAY